MKTKLDSIAAQPALGGMNFNHDCFGPGGCRCRRIGSLFPMLLVLVIAVLACTGLSSTARAQSLTWNESDVNAMWNAYTNDFYNLDGAGYYVFTSQSGGTTITAFWEEAQEIEMAEDGYDWASRGYNSLGNANEMASQINELCAGFVAHNGSLWTADQYDDDLNWAEIAFARAYQITGNSAWLSAATNNFNYVWANGQVNGITDGSWGLTQERGTQRMYANVNFTFVIAGYLLYDITGDKTYKSEADAIYTWAKTNLYVYNHLPAKNGSSEVCSMIYNYNNSEFGGSIQNRDCMYNYGIAIRAACFENDITVAQTVANWMIYNVDADTNRDGVPYAGTYGGYNVLPDYGAGGNNGDNDCGYDGIGLRGFGVALMEGALTNPDALPFAQANLQSAWNHRSSDNLEWCGWTTTPSGTKYSWGDSAAMAGMFDIPAPDQPINPSAAVTPDGRDELFAIGRTNGPSNTGYLYHNYQLSPDGAAGWSGWIALGSTNDIWPDSSIPAVGMNSNGCLEVFIIDTNGHVNSIQQTVAGPGSSTNWSSFSVLDSSASFDQSSKIATGNRADGSLEVFAVDTAGTLMHNHNAAGSGWTGFVSMGGSWDLNDDIAVGNEQDGCLTVAMVGVNNGHLYDNSQSSTTANFGTSWTDIVGNLALNQSSHLALGYNTVKGLEAFVVNPDDNSAYHCWETASNSPTSWHNWSSLGGSWSANCKPVVGDNTNHTEDVFLVGNNGNMYHSYYGSSGWSSWTNWDNSIAFPANVRPCMVLDGAGANKLEIFGVSTNAVMYHAYEKTAGSHTSWGHFSSMGGSWD